MSNSTPAGASPGSAPRPTPAELEARIAAMSALVKSLLTTLMLRGLLNRAEIAPLIAEAEKLITASDPAAKIELAEVAADLPAFMREAMGPPPGDDEHDH